MKEISILRIRIHLHFEDGETKTMKGEVILKPSSRPGRESKTESRSPDSHPSAPSTNPSCRLSTISLT